MCGSSSFSPSKKPWIELTTELTVFFAALIGVSIADLIPFQTVVAVVLIPLNTVETVLFTDSNTVETLLLIPSTTVEIAVLMPFQTVDAVLLIELNAVETADFTALSFVVTVETMLVHIPVKKATINRNLMNALVAFII